MSDLAVLDLGIKIRIRSPDLCECHCIEKSTFVIVFSILEFVLQLEVCSFTQRDSFIVMYKCVDIPV